MERKDGISVIVCCYNSAERLDPTLNHLFKQQVEDRFPWEIIIVDNNSSDNTAEVAQALFDNASTTTDFRIMDEPNPGLMNARKCGIKNCRYDLMLFVDDDNWLEENYVTLCYEIMTKRSNTGVLGGLGTPANEQLPDWFLLYADSYAVGPQGKNGNVPFVYGAGMCIRKKAWFKLQNNGFKSILLGRTGKSLTAGEDTETCYAIRLAGYDITYDDRLQFKHDLPDSRLNWEHLKKLFLGFGMAKAQLDIYTACLKGNPLPKDGKLPFWFNRIVFLIQQLIPEIPLLIKSRFSSMEGNGELLMTLGKVGQIKGIFAARKEYIKRYKRVYELAQKLKDD